jgi:hypothetical protein
LGGKCPGERVSFWEKPRLLVFEKGHGRSNLRLF